METKKRASRLYSKSCLAFYKELTAQLQAQTIFS